MKKSDMAVGMIVLAALWSGIGIWADAKEGTMAVFTMSEKGETSVQVKAGEAFALRFLTSPGTGYSWELAAPLNEKSLAILETRIEGNESGLLGGSEYELWVCRALSAGCSEIALNYVRPWEKDAEPAKKHVFKVQIL